MRKYTCSICWTLEMSKCSYSVSCFSPIRALINNSTGAIAVVCSSRAVHRTAATAFDSILSENIRTGGVNLSVS